MNVTRPLIATLLNFNDDYIINQVLLWQGFITIPILIDLMANKSIQKWMYKVGISSTLITLCLRMLSVQISAYLRLNYFHGYSTIPSAVHFGLDFTLALQLFLLGLQELTGPAQGKGLTRIVIITPWIYGALIGGAFWCTGISVFPSLFVRECIAIVCFLLKYFVVSGNFVVIIFIIVLAFDHGLPMDCEHGMTVFIVTTSFAGLVLHMAPDFWPMTVAEMELGSACFTIFTIAALFCVGSTTDSIKRWLGAAPTATAKKEVKAMILRRANVSVVDSAKRSALWLPA